SVAIQTAPEGGPNSLRPEEAVASVRKIIFACEAGMGSSAMGAAMLKKQLQKTGLGIEVDNSSIDENHPETELIICHQKLTKRIRREFPDKMVYPLQSFTDIENYEKLVRLLEKGMLRKNGSNSR
ncbi:MAG: hypothetical protein LOD87_05985, partial [Planifilum fulgidum]